MQEITIGDISTFVISLAALIGAASVIINALRKMKQNTVDNYEKMTTEMTLLLQLTMALVSELQEGEIDVKTSSAMSKLNTYLIEQATRVS